MSRAWFGNVVTFDDYGVQDMSPQWLVAEGPMPGRPSLKGQVIDIQGKESVNEIALRGGKVIHEDASGVIVKVGEDSTASYQYPFNYKVIQDA